ncbi:unnamed protein product [Orchesella dallaii]|uniref:Uncharacterized protein n=1 Tax=Orchesella dallaii TaxID=48710 RepID=A0ABP1PUA5_9HEXA
MKAVFIVPVAVLSALVLFYVQEASAIKCYVCQDCESSLESSHLQNCSKREEKCVKMLLGSGEVDRMCGDKNRCAGRGNGRSKRSIDEEIEDLLPKRRIVRQLLGGDSGGSSSSNKDKNKKNNKEKQKEEKKGAKDASEIHCCAEDGCNGVFGFPQHSFSLILLSLVFVTLSSSFHSSFQYFQV